MISRILQSETLSADEVYGLDLLGVLRLESSSAENSSEESTERRMKSSLQRIHPTLTARALLPYAVGHVFPLFTSGCWTDGNIGD